MRPALFLLILSPLLGEVMSSNTPLSAFWSRPIDLIFAFVTYGVPAILIRELFASRRLTLWALLLCGAAYGIFNEGLMARTLELSSGLPIGAFDHGPMTAGVNVYWCFTMLVWHALFSVAAPIVAAHWLWPAEADRAWWPAWARAAGGAVVAAASSLYFMRHDPLAPSPTRYAGFVAAIASLLLFASRLRRPAEASQWSFSWATFFSGILFFGFFAGLFFVAARGYSPLVFFTYAAVSLALAGRALRAAAEMENGFLLFGLGNCVAYSLFVFAAKLRANVEGEATTFLFLAAYLSLLAAAKQRQRP